MKETDDFFRISIPTNISAKYINIFIYKKQNVVSFYNYKICKETFIID